MKKLLESMSRLMGHDPRIRAPARARANARPVTLRDPAWLVRSSGWAPVGAIYAAAERPDPAVSRAMKGPGALI